MSDISARSAIVQLSPARPHPDAAAGGPRRNRRDEQELRTHPAARCRGTSAISGVGRERENRTWDVRRYKKALPANRTRTARRAGGGPARTAKWRSAPGRRRCGGPCAPDPGPGPDFGMAGSPDPAHVPESHAARPSHSHACSRRPVPRRAAMSSSVTSLRTGPIAASVGRPVKMRCATRTRAPESTASILSLSSETGSGRP